MMKQQTETKQQYIPAGDRRRYRRYVGEPVHILVRSGCKPVRGIVINESIGGLALVAPDAAAILVGQQVEVVLHEVTSSAYIRSVDRQADGTYRVSVSWDPPSATDANNVATYLVYDNLLLVCRVLDASGSTTRSVRLWDGSEFQVPPEALRSRSFPQRRDELNESPAALSALVEFYGLSLQTDTSRMVSEILDFEFPSSS
jgi:hypothetical protein